VDVVIVDAVHTPFAPRGGDLAGWHPVDLFAEVLIALRERTSFEGSELSHVYAGCMTPIGEQALNVARLGLLAAQWPENIAGSTLDGDLAASQLAVHSAIAAVASGSVDLCVAGGVESTSRIHVGASTGAGLGKPFGPAVHLRYAEGGGLVSPGMIANEWQSNMASTATFSMNMLPKVGHPPHGLKVLVTRSIRSCRFL